MNQVIAKNSLISRQFLMFIIAGGTAAGVNFASRFFYNQWMGFSAAVILAYITGMIFAFILTKTFVFKTNTQTVTRSAIIFILVNVIAILQTWSISVFVKNYLLPFFECHSFSNEIAHAFGIIIPAFTSYFGHKNFSFKQSP